MKQSAGFTRLLPSVVAIAAMIVSFALLAWSMGALPLGTAYTIWTGIDAVGAFTLDIMVLGKSANPLLIVAALMNVSGLVLMNLFSPGGYARPTVRFREKEDQKTSSIFRVESRCCSRYWGVLKGDQTMNSLAAALMFFSLASPVYEAGSIQGSVSVFEAGYKLDCVRVWLIPRSPEIDAAIDLKFGALDEGLHEMPATSRPDARSEPPVGTRESRCLGRFTERFGFSEVPPGEYYLTLTAAPRVRYESENKLSPTTIEMMQRVTVAPGSSVTSDFRLIG